MVVGEEHELGDENSNNDIDGVGNIGEDNEAFGLVVDDVITGDDNVNDSENVLKDSEIENSNAAIGEDNEAEIEDSVVSGKDAADGVEVDDVLVGENVVNDSGDVIQDSELDDSTVINDSEVEESIVTTDDVNNLDVEVEDVYVAENQVVDSENTIQDSEFDDDNVIVNDVEAELEFARLTPPARLRPRSRAFRRTGAGPLAGVRFLM